MARDSYGPMGSVPEVTGGGTVGQRFGARATPDDFGAQVGEAQQEQGAMGLKLGQMQMERQTKYAEMATEAKVNDDFANKYAPAAADLRNAYDQLQGQDKIHGYDGYVKSLSALNSGFMKEARSPYEQQLWSGMLSKRLASETESAKGELVASQIDLSNRAATDKIKTEAGYAAANYNNPAIVEDAQRSIDATIALQHIDNGVDPNSDAGKSGIEVAQREARGQLATGMIQSAVTRGDINEAVKIRQKYGPEIPGHQQLAIDNTLHVQSMKQVGVYGAAAFKNGLPLPPVVGQPAAQVQAVVADTAQRDGIDPNHALTVAMIESNMGQDLGARGDIGQTGKGGDLGTQAKNMVTALKESQAIAQKALERIPEHWETYVCYQQGAGGGPALLRAAMDNPTAKAVDVLAPLYKDPKTAIDAIVHNGGNTTMTAGDFLAFIKRKYDANAARAQTEMPKTQETEQFGPEAPTLLAQKAPPTLGDAILKPHASTGETVQPATTPRSALLNFDAKMPQMIARANEIPNLSVRQAVLENIRQDRSQLASGAAGYSATLINSAQKLAVDPDFTSMDKVPPDLMAELLTEHPETLNYLENKAKQNLADKGGATTHDMKEYGPGMYGLMRDIASNKITSVTELMQHLPGRDGEGGDLTIAGFDKLKNYLIKDPQSAADTKMLDQTLKVVKRQVSGEDDALGFRDPKGEELFGSALPKVLQAWDDGKAKGLSTAELTDPKSTNWIGLAAQGLKRTPEQMNADMLAAADAVTPKKAQAAKDEGPRTMGAIMQDYYATNDLEKREALRKEALALGFIREDGPSAPIAE